ncbi:MAG: serine/threonine-protein kinase [Myxococcaceae bacterium]|nr:serine/threonine-protein kinase [Myxococcaceae bacterium]
MSGGAWDSRAAYSVTPAPGPDDDDAGPPPARTERYVIGGLLGSGGMGEVRLAFDTVLGREVAVKVPKTPEQAARLLHEAKVCARLEHPSIVPLYDAGTLADGRTFYAMRVVPGLDLAHWVQQQGSQAPTKSEALRLVTRVAHALAHAHQRGIIHRDLSPRNVRVGPNDEVTLLDWGLAAPADASATGRCGTPGFTAPEVEAGGAASVASDVWSLGALLAFCLDRVRSGRVSPAVHDVVARALAPAVPARYPDAAALAADLEACVQDRPVSWRREGLFEWLARQTRRNPRFVAALLGGLGLTVLLSVVLGVTETRARRSTELAARKTLEASVSLRVATASSLLQDGLDADAARLTGELLALAPDPSTPELEGLRAVTAGVTAARLEPRARGVCEAVIDPSTKVSFCRAGGRLTARRSDAVLTAPLPWGEGLSVGELGPARRLVSVLPVEGGAPRALEVMFGGSARVVHGAARAAVVFSDGVVWVPREGPLRSARPCAEGVPLGALGLDDAGDVAVCGGLFVDLGHPEREHQSPLRGPTAVLKVPMGWLVGTVHGQLAVLSADFSRLHTFVDGHAGPVREVWPLDASRVAVVTSERLGVWDWRRGAWDGLVPVQPDDRFEVDGDEALIEREDQRLVLQRGAGGPGHVALGHGIASLALAPDGDVVALGAADGSVWLVRPGHGVQAVHPPPAHPQVVKALAFSADGQSLLVGAAGPEGLQWLSTHDASAKGPPIDYRSRVVGVLGDTAFAVGWSASHWSNGYHPEAPWGLTSAAVRVSSHAASRRAVVLDADGQVSVLEGGALTTRSTGHTKDTRLALSPDGAHLAITDGTSLQTGAFGGATPLLRATVDGAPIDSVAVGPGGRLVALGRRDGSVEVVEGLTGRVRLRVTPFRGKVVAAAFSPTEPWLVTASWDGTARFLDLSRLEASTR